MDRIKFPLSDIGYVLLDMDGTLLDKYFDDFFWEQLVPEKYAEKHAMTFGRSKEELGGKYRFHEGTLNWTDLDFWSRELNLDIPALKEQIQHLIEVHTRLEGNATLFFQVSFAEITTGAYSRYVHAIDRLKSLNMGASNPTKAN